MEFAVNDQAAKAKLSTSELQEFMYLLLGAQATRYSYHQMQEIALHLFGLSEIERLVARFLLTDIPYERIASTVHLSLSSLKRNTQNIFEKVSVSNRREFKHHIARLVERV